MNEPLLPCPFCGNKGCVGEVDNTFYVTCCNCFIEVYPYTILDSFGTTNRWTREEAIKAWNARTPPPAVMKFPDNKECVYDNLPPEISKELFWEGWNAAIQVCKELNELNSEVVIGESGLPIMCVKKELEGCDTQCGCPKCKELNAPKEEVIISKFIDPIIEDALATPKGLTERMNDVWQGVSKVEYYDEQPSEKKECQLCHSTEHHTLKCPMATVYRSSEKKESEVEELAIELWAVMDPLGITKWHNIGKENQAFYKCRASHLINSGWKKEGKDE